MASASINITIDKDTDGNATRVNYALVNLGVRQWYAFWINDVKAKRFRTNNQGNLTGFLDPIPSEYLTALIAIGGFSTRWGDSANIPSSGMIAGMEALVEDTFGDGATEFPNVGIWTIELRHD